MRRLLEHYGFTLRLTNRRRQYLVKVLSVLQREDAKTARNEPRAPAQGILR